MDEERRQRAIFNWEQRRPVVRGTRGVVAAGTSLVTQVTMNTLAKGGNAVDAGVAALLAGGRSRSFRITASEGRLRY